MSKELKLNLQQIIFAAVTVVLGILVAVAPQTFASVCKVTEKTHEVFLDSTCRNFSWNFYCSFRCFANCLCLKKCEHSGKHCVQSCNRRKCHRRYPCSVGINRRVRKTYNALSFSYKTVFDCCGNSDYSCRCIADSISFTSAFKENRRLTDEKTFFAFNCTFKPFV